MKRNTLQRQIILDTAQSLDAHPSAEELYLEIQKKHSVLGRSTVYRNLRQLAEERVIAQIVLEGVVKYDKRTELHYHFICDVCGEIFDIEIDHEVDFNAIVCNKYGFKPDRHKLEFFGVCTDCAASG